MLENINIDDFKRTQRIWAERYECLSGLKSTSTLARVNLIGGLNGIGKTALLNIIATKPDYDKDFLPTVFLPVGFLFIQLS